MSSQDLHNTYDSQNFDSPDDSEFEDDKDFDLIAEARPIQEPEEDEAIEFIDQRYSEDKDYRLSGNERLKLEIFRDLRKPCNKREYSQKLKDASMRLGKSVRQVRRDFEKWKLYGPASLIATPRADKGQPRKNKEYWHELAVKIYKAGNKGKNSLARHKVVERVETRAYELAKLELKSEILEFEKNGLVGKDLDEEIGALIQSREKGEGFRYWKEYGKPPSRRTVERWLKPLEEEKYIAKTNRSPGWHNSKLVLRPKSGRELEIQYSNQVWQVDHTKADILLVDKEGVEIGRPNLTTVIDTHSRCIVGFRLGFSAPSAQVVALALRHAILPKSYGPEYQLRGRWSCYGVPAYLFTDNGSDFKSNHVTEWIADQVGFETEFRSRPSEGGIVERPFRTMSQLLSDVEGFVGANVLERPENAEARACLTLSELEWLLVGYIVDSYNQKPDSRTQSNPFMATQSRIERWQQDLTSPPVLMKERELDICLMKAEERVVKDNGYLRFANLMYKGENLGAYSGHKVILRFDPRDITMVMVYDRNDNREKFLARAYAVGLEAEKLSLEDIKKASADSKKRGKGINNITILEEAIRRREFLNSKANKTKSERRKIEQEEFDTLPSWHEEEKPNVVESSRLEEEELDEPIEKIDYDLMRQELGL
jgi:putative transposase